MKLGDKIKFQKELIKNGNRKSDETIAFAESLKVKMGRFGLNWGVHVNKNIKEGIVCGKRMIDLNGTHDWEDGYAFGKGINVYLIATKMSGFHRVPEQFLINDATST